MGVVVMLNTERNGEGWKRGSGVAVGGGIVVREDEDCIDGTVGWRMKVAVERGAE